jgi:hypothetical protein
VPDVGAAQIKMIFQRTSVLFFLIIPEISLCNISGITTKAPCEAALMGERHMRIEISDFVMRAFVLMVWSSKAGPHLPV